MDWELREITATRPPPMRQRANASMPKHDQNGRRWVHIYFDRNRPLPLARKTGHVGFAAIGAKQRQESQNVKRICESPRRTQSPRCWKDSNCVPAGELEFARSDHYWLPA